MITSANYRKGGLFLSLFVIIALLIAYLLDAPFAALLSIGGFGFISSIVLIIIGDKSKPKNDVNEVE